MLTESTGSYRTDFPLEEVGALALLSSDRIILQKMGVIVMIDTYSGVFCLFKKTRTL